MHTSQPARHGCRLAAVALAVLAFSPCTGARGQSPAPVAYRGQVPITIPYEIRDGLLTIRITFGSGQPVTAVLDTSLRTCVLGPELVDSMHLTRGAKTPVRTLLGIADGASVGMLDVGMGGLTLSSVPFVCADLWAVLSSRRPQMPAQAWLGMPLFAAFAVTIDPAQRTVTLATPASAASARGASVGVDLNGGSPTIDARLNGKESQRMRLATGLTGTLLPREMMEHLGIIPEATLTVTQPTGGDARLATLHVQDVAIGSAKLRAAPAVAWMEGDPGGLEPGLAVIGIDWLLRFRLTLDIARSRLLLEDPGPIRPVRGAPARRP